MKETEQLRNGVRQAYSSVAKRPEDEHPFPVGRRFAESLGYPSELIAGLPSICVDAFSGVSNVGIFAEIPDGATVLDLGCGAGLDSLIAAQRTGHKGRVVGVDFSDDMLLRASRAAAEAGLDNVRFERADAENLPIESATIDVVLVNGIFNLNPGRNAIFRELARVVRKDGAVYAAELILREPLPPGIQYSDDDWFA